MTKIEIDNEDAVEIKGVTEMPGTTTTDQMLIAILDKREESGLNHSAGAKELIEWLKVDPWERTQTLLTAILTLIVNSPNLGISFMTRWIQAKVAVDKAKQAYLAKKRIEQAQINGKEAQA